MAITLDAVKNTLAGRYEVVSVLGRGGMSHVFLAHDPARQRYVAVKVLRPEFAATLLAHRFHQEIAILASLDHPHILPLLESRDAGNLVYYVMPYAEGDSLRKRMEHEGPLEIETAVGIASEVAAALDYAHAHDIVHRDIKPENIMFEGGCAKVCDFGVARALVQAGGERISSSGLVVGTPGYMSPEQARGAAQLDGRSDIYSLGCVVFEMLAGEPPFTGRTAQAIMARHARQPPPSLRVVRPGVPEQVERAVHQALAKSPEDRPGTGGDFLGLLHRAGSQ